MQHRPPLHASSLAQTRGHASCVWALAIGVILSGRASGVVAQPVQAASSCPDAAPLERLAQTATDDPAWRTLLRALRLPRARSARDFHGEWCGEPVVEVSHYWANGVGGECASLAVRVVQSCGVGECGDGVHDPIHARITIDARGRLRIAERLSQRARQPTLRDSVTGLPISHAIPHDDGPAHTIVPTRDGRLHPWQVADARLPDLDGDGWPEFFLQGPDNRTCAMPGDNCSDYCCVYSRQAFLASSRTARILGGPLVYSGLSSSSDISSALLRAAEEFRRSESCPASANVHIYGPPAAFLSAPEPRLGSSQTHLRASHNGLYCQEYASDMGYGWSGDASCVPSGVLGGGASITLPPLESWRAELFTGRVDVREVWPAPPTLAVSSALDGAGCAGFVSGVPVVTANLTEPLAALHFVATGPDGLLLEGPDGRVTCASRSGSSVALAVHNLIPGQYRLHVRSGAMSTGSSNLHLGISADGPISQDAVYTSPSRFCPTAAFGPCCQPVADPAACHHQG